MPFSPSDVPLKYTQTASVFYFYQTYPGSCPSLCYLGKEEKEEPTLENWSGTSKVEHLDLYFYRCLSWGTTKGKAGEPEQPLPSPASKPQHENQQPSSSEEKSPSLRKALVFFYSFYKCESPDVILPFSLLIIHWVERRGHAGEHRE